MQTWLMASTLAVVHISEHAYVLFFCCCCFLGGGVAGGAGRALVRVLLERQEVAGTEGRHGEGHEKGCPGPYRAAARAEGADGQERG